MECNRASDVRIVQKQSLDDQQTQHMPNSRLLSILYSTTARPNILRLIPFMFGVRAGLNQLVKDKKGSDTDSKSPFGISASADYSRDNAQTIYEPPKTTPINISLPPDWTIELRRTDDRFVCTTWSESARVDGFEFLVGPIGEEWSIN